MQALTDILRAMRLSGGVFLEAEFTEPWCISAGIGPEDCRPLMTPPARLVAYHYVLEGRVQLGIEGEQEVSAGARELLLLPRNDTHLLGSALDVPPLDAESLIEAGEDGLARIRCGGGGARTRVLCGFLGSDDPGDPLLSSLPRLIRLDLGERLAGDWIEGSIRYAAQTLAAGGAGTAASLAHLAELLFGEAIREYLESLPSDERNWLSGLRDPYVARALTLLHSRLDYPWSLPELAREAGLSRSALNERFARYVKVAPMRYLAGRRLARAAEQLCGGRESVARIAVQAGYESEAAFTRAFKRHFGKSPGAYRKSVSQETVAH